MTQPNGLVHVLLVRHVAGNYVTAHWKYDDLDWARWKKAEMEYYDRRHGDPQLIIKIVSI